MKLNKCEEENVLSSLDDLTAQPCAKYGSNCHSIWKDWGNLLSLRMVTSLSVTLCSQSIGLRSLALSLAVWQWGTYDLV